MEFAPPKVVKGGLKIDFYAKGKAGDIGGHEEILSLDAVIDLHDGGGFV